ncbi:MAG: hypothetical protein M1591_07575 [Deltaproteobacteria bacterium]|nr:hypothetical protein [Deltaproteobacteria bacterium]
MFFFIPIQHNPETLTHREKIAINTHKRTVEIKPAVDSRCPNKKKKKLDKT